MAKNFWKVFITRRIPVEAIALLQQDCIVDVHNSDEAIPREILLSRVDDIDGLLCLLSDTIDREVLDKASHVKVISNFAVGYDNIDVTYATKKGIVVTNTPGILTDATADFSWALLLAVSRRIIEGDRKCRNKLFKGWGPMMLLGQDLIGKTLGIVGAGRIGTAVAERSRGWCMKILYFDEKRNSYLEERFRAKRVSLNKLFQRSDFISVHLPLTPQTTHLINETVLNLLKSSAVLINTARGSIIDEAALLKALKQNRLAGAGLDVFEKEPHIHQSFLELDNVVLAPHIASATKQTRRKMAMIAAKNLLSVLNGNKPKSLVNKEVFPQMNKKYKIQLNRK
jgi:glyoxylate reductase